MAEISVINDTVHDRSNTNFPIREIRAEGSQLSRLIKSLEDKTIDPAMYARIKYPSLLITSLKELAAITGNATVKDSIAGQISYLLNEPSRRKLMLNTILYGPPGCGKTTMGTKLAKIWYSLGYLETKNAKKWYNLIGDKVGDDQGQGQLLAIILLIVYSFAASALSAVVTVYRYVGLWYFMFIIIGFFVVLLVIYYFWINQNNDSWINTYNNYVNDLNKANTPNNNAGAGSIYCDADVGCITEKDIIKIVSREDFVDKYVGWSDKKTKTLLEESRGKVLFIDEAYSLVTSNRDQYGIEAVNTINRFVSENPDEIIIIFGGYKDKMQNSIFSVQPGLARRCMWHFECQGYNGEELYSIFARQAQKEALQLKDSDRIAEIIKNNTKSFTSYGGDTERLLFFSKLEASRENFMSDIPSTTISADNVAFLLST